MRESYNKSYLPRQTKAGKLFEGHPSIAPITILPKRLHRRFIAANRPVLRRMLETGLVRPEWLVPVGTRYPSQRSTRRRAGS